MMFDWKELLYEQDLDVNNSLHSLDSLRTLSGVFQLASSQTGDARAARGARRFAYISRATRSTCVP